MRAEGHLRRAARAAAAATVTVLALLTAGSAVAHEGGHTSDDTVLTSELCPAPPTFPAPTPPDGTDGAARTSEFGSPTTYSLHVNAVPSAQRDSSCQLVLPGGPLADLQTERGYVGSTVRFTLESGSLPGLTLDTDGTWDGTAPTTPGTYTARISLANVQNTVEWTFTLLVGEHLRPTGEVPGDEGPGDEGSGDVTCADSVQTIDPGGTPAPLRFSRTSGAVMFLDQTTRYTGPYTLPDGLTFWPDGTFEQATWTPGRYVIGFYVQALTDDGLRAGHCFLTLTVTSAGVSQFEDTATNTAQRIDIGATPDPLTATATPGRDRVIYVSAGKLPVGLALGSDGEFTGGAAAAGAYPVTVAVDVNGRTTDTRPFTLTVGRLDPLIFTAAGTNTAQSLTVGQTPRPLAVTGAAGLTRTFSVTGGDLPTGVTLRPDGTFTGTANTPGGSRADIVVVTGDGQSATTALSVSVSAPQPPPAPQPPGTKVPDGPTPPVSQPQPPAGPTTGPGPASSTGQVPGEVPAPVVRRERPTGTPGTDPTGDQPAPGGLPATEPDQGPPAGEGTDADPEVAPVLDVPAREPLGEPDSGPDGEPAPSSPPPSAPPVTAPPIGEDRSWQGLHPAVLIGGAAVLIGGAAGVAGLLRRRA